MSAVVFAVVDMYFVVVEVGSLVEFEAVEAISPLEFERQGNMDDWLILEKIEDVVVGTSVPYDYKNARFKS